ncbi:MAG: putative glycoside hydrolase/deacetylase ChbG (UPF0249 family) [Maribacter sp.]|jgi:predicted glycoside hydrolase/deacetylase ChbG (UPF0249 family)
MNTAQQLGYSKNTKLLIIHVDDAGLSHSQNRATIRCLKTGIVNSYSIMVPCPWYYEIAVFAKNNPKFDYGIHLTLTCEWETYKFGPVLPLSEVPSLVDENGYFYKTREELKKNAKPEHVYKELDAQVQKALKFGLEPTHLDVHMYSVGAHADFFEAYKNLGETYKLPTMVSGELLSMVGLNPTQIIKPEDLTTQKIHIGNYDLFVAGALNEYYAQAADNLVPGLNVLLIHPAYDDMEMKGITINHPNFGAEWRQIDTDFFTDLKNKSLFDKEDIRFVTWRELKSVQR